MLSRKLRQLYLLGFFHCHNTQKYHKAFGTVPEDGNVVWCYCVLRQWNNPTKYN